MSTSSSEEEEEEASPAPGEAATAAAAAAASAAGLAGGGGEDEEEVGFLPHANTVHAQARTCAHTRAHTHTHTHTHSLSHTQKHARARASAHMHTHTHMRAGGAHHWGGVAGPDLREVRETIRRVVRAAGHAREGVCVPQHHVGPHGSAGCAPCNCIVVIILGVRARECM